jgi:hypothetical protein
MKQFKEVVQRTEEETVSIQVNNTVLFRLQFTLDLLELVSDDMIISCELIPTTMKW